MQIRYELAIQPKADQAALLAITDQDGVPSRRLFVAKDSSKDWPWREKELIAELTDRLEIRITSHDVRAVVFAHKVKSRPEWFYQGKVTGSPGQYSTRFADWFVARFKRHRLLDRLQDGVRRGSSPEGGRAAPRESCGGGSRRQDHWCC